MGCEDWRIGGLAGDCAGISLQAEGRAMQWSRGVGRRLRLRDFGGFALVAH